MNGPTRETLHGGCLCRAVRFEVPGPPRWVAYCHCGSCRRQTASPVSCYAGFDADTVHFTAAVPTYHGSSPGVVRGFCARCGTPLTYAAQRFPGELHLFTGVFDAPEKLQAGAHVFWHERLPGFDLHDPLPRYGLDPQRPEAWGPQPVHRVLFLCTGNSDRSILAEALVNSRHAYFEGLPIIAHSAGSNPAGEVNPGALAVLNDKGVGGYRLRSKSWNEFTGTGAPAFRWVITLCDSARNDRCPVFPGPAERLHWGLPDPATGAATFEQTWDALQKLVRDFFG